MDLDSILDKFIGKSFKSRKFLLALLALVLVTGVSIGGIWSTALAGVMPSFISGILGVLALYFAGNVSNSYVATKVLGLVDNVPKSSSSSSTTTTTSTANKTEGNVVENKEV